jgi:hypothetical protein
MRVFKGNVADRVLLKVGVVQVVFFPRQTPKYRINEPGAPSVSYFFCQLHSGIAGRSRRNAREEKLVRPQTE